MSKSALAAKLPDYDDVPGSSGFHLDTAIERIAHWLPTQGPIKDFIHHNTLHAVQDRPFHEGVAIAANLFGARSYLPLADYQAMYREGRIRDFAIDWALEHSGAGRGNSAALRESLFQTDDEVHYPPVSLANHGIRERWLTHIQVNLNALVHPILFRLVANFLDQGISGWSVARDGESLWDCVWRLVENSVIPLHPFSETSARAVINQSADEAILACLGEIVGSEPLYEQYVMEMLLAHPGWAGMVHLIEQNPQALLAKRRISLKELIAVELACELAFLHRKRGAGFLPVAKLPHLSQVPRLADATAKPLVPLRLKVWHEAMEFSLHAELLQALKVQAAPAAIASSDKAVPMAQAFFCIDDRECSLRRHLEEIDPRIETFGAAGFFGIDFLYKGLDDAYPVAQCPVVIQPKHLVLESSCTRRPPRKSPRASSWGSCISRLSPWCATGFTRKPWAWATPPAWPGTCSVPARCCPKSSN
ncbi:putative inorganic carbon transporter subunit DabA [Methylogaea oryzae]|uniref:putative inorganic carbon transporter subunit DabA n=1 Tax=Methylogaea oryzae TaxID=1295382 RepID=UPI000AF56E11|nr:putative inorganic carbon transporter subunit DabA [Methylogaea oryzae]